LSKSRFLVASVTAAWSGDVPPGRVRIEVEPADPPFGAQHDTSTAAARGLDL
jgi:hypothetical protein